MNSASTQGFSKLRSSMENTYKNLILSSDASQRDVSNGIRVAYVNFYNMWAKTWLKIKHQLPNIPKYEKIDYPPVNQASASDDWT